jgi:hypothetical protein
VRPSPSVPIEHGRVGENKQFRSTRALVVGLAAAVLVLLVVATVRGRVRVLVLLPQPGDHRVSLTPCVSPESCDGVCVDAACRCC